MKTSYTGLWVRADNAFQNSVTESSVARAVSTREDNTWQAGESPSPAGSSGGGGGSSGGGSGSPMFTTWIPCPRFRWEAHYHGRREHMQDGDETLQISKPCTQYNVHNITCTHTHTQCWVQYVCIYLIVCKVRCVLIRCPNQPAWFSRLACEVQAVDVVLIRTTGLA